MDNHESLRVAFNFDLIVENLDMYYPSPKKPNPEIHSRAYYDIEKYFKQNGVGWRSGSGYTSNGPMSLKRAAILIEQMSQDLPWLDLCVRVFDVTEIRNTYSLIPTIEGKGIADSSVGRPRKWKPSDKQVHNALARLDKTEKETALQDNEEWNLPDGQVFLYDILELSQASEDDIDALGDWFDEGYGFWDDDHYVFLFSGEEHFLYPKYNSQEKLLGWSLDEIPEKSKGHRDDFER